MRIHHLFSFLCILALLLSCNSGKEGKASAFLHENNRNYTYTETSLVGKSGNRIPFSPYQYATLYGAQDTLETKSSATIVPPWAKGTDSFAKPWSKGWAWLKPPTGRLLEAV